MRREGPCDVGGLMLAKQGKARQGQAVPTCSKHCLIYATYIPHDVVVPNRLVQVNHP